MFPSFTGQPFVLVQLHISVRDDDLNAVDDDLNAVNKKDECLKHHPGCFNILCSIFVVHIAVT